MASPRAAATVPTSELGSYQRAARLVLSHPLITAAYPRAGQLASVLRWQKELTEDLRSMFGYTLQASRSYVRLIRQLDEPAAGSAFFTAKKRPFDRRRIAYACLLLSCLHRSRVEINLNDLVRVLRPVANAIEGLGFDPTVGAHRAALVDVVAWFCERGALTLSDGSVEAWEADPGVGDALYDLDHDILIALFKPGRSLQHLRSFQDLLQPPPSGSGRDTVRRHTAQRARRALVEQPVVYFATIDADLASALRSPTLGEDLAQLTGLRVERRAEGMMLVDTTGRCTDRAFPGAGSVARAAGLLLAKIADEQEEPTSGSALPHLPLPALVDIRAESHGGVDQALPPTQSDPADQTVAGPGEGTGHPRGRRSVRPEDASAAGPGATGPGATGPGAAGPQPSAPFVDDTLLSSIMTQLYDDLGARTFTAQWEHDPVGLRRAAVSLLEELRLVHQLPGGVLVLPAAARYRNISQALPRSHDPQLAFDLSTGEETT
jgi:uncharacterized protein (TIGR02678 family)